MIDEIGSSIRRIRKEQGRTINDIAQKAGLTIGLISQIERGQANPSLASLQAIANALEIPISILFQESINISPVVRKNERRRLILNKTTNSYLEALTHKMSDAPIGYYLMEGPAGYVNETYSEHPGEEFIFILSGSLKFTLGRDTYILEEGDSIHYDSMIPHHGVIIGDQPTRFILIVSPPGPFIDTLWEAV